LQELAIEAQAKEQPASGTGHEVNAADAQKIQATLRLLSNIHKSVRSLTAHPPAVQSGMGHDVNAARLKSHLLNEVAEIHDAEAAGHVSGAVAQAIHRVLTPIAGSLGVMGDADAPIRRPTTITYTLPPAGVSGRDEIPIASPNGAKEHLVVNYVPIGHHQAKVKIQVEKDGGATSWGYSLSDGPKVWPRLFSKQNKRGQCDGKEQSPVDILREKLSVPKHGISMLKTYYSHADKFWLESSENEQVLIRAATTATDHVLFESEQYTLRQMHFHHPSEHQIDGVTFPLEAQLEHRSANGKVLMISVLFQMGPANPFVSSLPWHKLPMARRVPISASLDPNVLMPSTKRYYKYLGSLTTPPCTERVQWVVLHDNPTVSMKQLTTFPFGNNARPVQQLDGRVLQYLSSPKVSNARSHKQAKQPRIVHYMSNAAKKAKEAGFCQAELCTLAEVRKWARRHAAQLGGAAGVLSTEGKAEQAEESRGHERKKNDLQDAMHELEHREDRKSRKGDWKAHVLDELEAKARCLRDVLHGKMMMGNSKLCREVLAALGLLHPVLNKPHITRAIKAVQNRTIHNLVNVTPAHSNAVISIVENRTITAVPIMRHHPLVPIMRHHPLVPIMPHHHLNPSHHVGPVSDANVTCCFDMKQARPRIVKPTHMPPHCSPLPASACRAGLLKPADEGQRGKDEDKDERYGKDEDQERRDTDVSMVVKLNPKGDLKSLAMVKNVIVVKYLLCAPHRISLHKTAPSRLRVKFHSSKRPHAVCARRLASTFLQLVKSGALRGLLPIVGACIDDSEPRTAVLEVPAFADLKKNSPEITEGMKSIKERLIEAVGSKAFTIDAEHLGGSSVLCQVAKTAGNDAGKTIGEVMYQLKAKIVQGGLFSSFKPIVTAMKASKRTIVQVTQPVCRHRVQDKDDKDDDDDDGKPFKHRVQRRPEPAAAAEPEPEAAAEPQPEVATTLGLVSPERAPGSGRRLLLGLGEKSGISKDAGHASEANRGRSEKGRAEQRLLKMEDEIANAVNTPQNRVRLQCLGPSRLAIHALPLVGSLSGKCASAVIKDMSRVLTTMTNEDRERLLPHWPPVAKVAKPISHAMPRKLPPTIAPTNLPRVVPKTTASTTLNTIKGTIFMALDGDIEELTSFDRLKIQEAIAGVFGLHHLHDVLIHVDGGSIFLKIRVLGPAHLTFPQGFALLRPLKTLASFRVLCISSIRGKCGPTKAPTTKPTITPTTSAPTPNGPTHPPSASPTATPSALPSTHGPSSHPSEMPSTPNPSRVPTAVPSASPTGAPSLPPTESPTFQPTEYPTLVPSLPPTAEPSWVPSPPPSTEEPTHPGGTDAPFSPVPTLAPSVASTLEPTPAPTPVPSLLPSGIPTDVPTTAAPVLGTETPTIPPTPAPTMMPTTLIPTPAPTTTEHPSMVPTPVPSEAPTAYPTLVPSLQPTTYPSWQPSPPPSTQMPTVPGATNAPFSPTPTLEPSPVSTLLPTPAPTLVPSLSPSLNPSETPTTGSPTDAPFSPAPLMPGATASPSNTAQPSTTPSSAPSLLPTSSPSGSPSLPPTPWPTYTPSAAPTLAPSSAPTTSPTTGSPSLAPSDYPSRSPSIAPSEPLPEVRVDLLKVSATLSPTMALSQDTNAPTSVTTITDQGKMYEVTEENGKVVGMEPKTDMALPTTSTEVVFKQ
jgi:carbonic anhydrase